MPNNPSLALEVTDMTVSYGRQQPVLWDVDLQIPRGSLTAIVGPNGAGKSTLIKAMLGLVPKTSGQTFVFDKPIKKTKLQVGYVPQKNSIDWNFPVTLYDVVLMGAYGRCKTFGILKKEEKKKALECIKQVGLFEYKHHQISALSGGQQQRTFLARALMQDSPIYLMDEPFAGVDIKTEKTIAKLFKEMQKNGKTLVVVHHDLATLKEYFDSLILLNKRIVAHGTISKTLTNKNLHITYTGKMNVFYPSKNPASKTVASFSMK